MNKDEISKQMEVRVAELLQLLEIEGTVIVDTEQIEGKDYLHIKVEAGEAGSELIGFHGNTLKSLSSIVGMMMPKAEEPLGLILDVNDYRQQRANYITEQTMQAIETAIETFEEVRMPPMSAWERRVVHMAAADRTDISTVSEGDGDDRRVVVKPVSII